MTEEINISTHAQFDAIDITSKINSVVRKSEIDEGICHVFVPHTTAGVTINEHADPAVIDDIMSELGKLVPLDDNNAHTEGNANAHIKSSMVGHDLTLLIERGSLRLGTWQGVFFCEFHGPRRRKAWLKVTA